jgi:hypothetical protein
MEYDDILCARKRLYLYIGKYQLRIGSRGYSQGLHQGSKVLKFMPITPMLDNEIVGSLSMLTCCSESRGEPCAGQQSIESNNSLPGREIEKDVQLLSANPAYRFTWPRDIYNDSVIDTIQQFGCCQILFHAEVNDVSLRKALPDILKDTSEENRISKSRRTNQSYSLPPLGPQPLTPHHTDEGRDDSKHRDTDPIIQ